MALASSLVFDEENPVDSPAPTPTKATTDFLRRVPYFRHLESAALEALARSAQRLEFKAGTVIFTQDEPSAGLFIVEQGEVKACHISCQGREQILHVICCGDTFNDVAAFDGGPNPVTAIARTDVVLWCISRSDLQRIAAAHPELAWALVESIAKRTRHLVRLVQDLTMRSVRGRLACLLLAQIHGQPGETIPRLMTQEEMAGRLGTVREMVGRALRDMAADGILRFDRHRIVILDPERLVKEARG